MEHMPVPVHVVCVLDYSTFHSAVGCAAQSVRESPEAEGESDDKSHCGRKLTRDSNFQLSIKADSTNYNPESTYVSFNYGADSINSDVKKRYVTTLKSRV